jgi:hypothetical protein
MISLVRPARVDHDQQLQATAVKLAASSRTTAAAYTFGFAESKQWRASYLRNGSGSPGLDQLIVDPRSFRFRLVSGHMPHTTTRFQSPARSTSWSPPYDHNLTHRFLMLDSATHHDIRRGRRPARMGLRRQRLVRRRIRMWVDGAAAGQSYPVI